jgi:hypothetical protein
LWYKCDDKLFHPIFSHFHVFCVDWGSLGSYYDTQVGLSSRASNQLNQIKSRLKKSWLYKLGLYGVVDSRSTNDAAVDGGIKFTHPAPCLRLAVSIRRKLAVKKPTAVAAKMLLMGKHPENGTDRLDWCTKRDGDKRPYYASHVLSEEQLAILRKGGSDRYQNSFIKPFEDAVSSLAYGAIRRENDLRDMSKPLNQMKLTLDETSSLLVEEMESLVGHVDKDTGLSAPFAPDKDEAGLSSSSYTRDFGELLRTFSKLSDRCNEAAEVYRMVLNMPDSSCPSTLVMGVDERWSMRTSSRIGVFDDLDMFRQWPSFPGGVDHSASRTHSACLVIRASAEVSEAEADAGVSLPDMYLVEHNIRGFSYYWVRRHKEFYETVLNQAGLKLPNLHGTPPQEWNYMELAAPLFMEEGQLGQGS